MRRPGWDEDLLGLELLDLQGMGVDPITSANTSRFCMAGGKGRDIAFTGIPGDAKLR